jgi:hypothetical protein
VDLEPYVAGAKLDPDFVGDLTISLVWPKRYFLLSQPELGLVDFEGSPEAQIEVRPSEPNKDKDDS